ncbi:hypothetical protein V4F39_02265 [Aquincola sp. MAHUQ-54]|uniref:Uncharacterized protein n=1 Tax=Aquincola agrisoli TaxID=3119538 RepID=A0AAW9QBD2_9BURK
MFSRFKPVPFDPYGRRRQRRLIPPWLWLWLSGVAIGGAGVVVVQQKYLPPRLSASESAALRTSHEQASAQRDALQRQLAETTAKLDAAQKGSAQAAGTLESSRAEVARLREDLAAVVAALPSDPRGGRVEIRAGQFKATGSALDYDLVLTRDGRSSGKPMSGVLQLVVAGEARGAESTVKAPPVTIQINGHQVVRGSVPLPDGFTPRETTIRILDRPAGEQVGMRVLRVR